MLQPSPPLYPNATDAARRMHAALLHAHNSRHSLIQSPVTHQTDPQIKQRRKPERRTHLVEQKDAWIGQGHPQIHGEICRLSTNLKVGGRGGTSHQVDSASSKHFRKQPLRGSSALRLDEPLPRLRLQLQLRLRLRLRHPRCKNLQFLDSWSMTVHKSHAHTQMGRLQLSW